MVGVKHVGSGEALRQTECGEIAVDEPSNISLDQIVAVPNLCDRVSDTAKKSNSRSRVVPP